MEVEDMFVIVIAVIVVVVASIAFPPLRSKVFKTAWHTRLLFSVIRKTSRTTTPSLPRRKVQPTTESYGIREEYGGHVFESTQLNNLFWELSTYGPGFKVESKNIEFLREPDQFYQQLMARIRTATQRVVLASLYLGHGHLEEDMIQELINACERSPNLKVTVLIDGLRGTRLVPGKQPGTKTSSLEMLLPLIQKFPKQATVYLYHTPNLAGLLKRILPQRYNEAMGVSHIKAYITDDSLLMTGANLSNDYFTERQDRYSWFHNTPSLADYFQAIVDVVGSFSYLLASDGGLYLPEGAIDPSKKPELFKEMAFKKVNALLKPHYYYYPNSKIITESSSLDGRYNSSSELEHGSTNPWGKGQKSLGPSTWVFPTIQMGQIQIRQDEEATSQILCNTFPTATLYITSPYFNLTNKYTSYLLESRGTVDVICASPQANGWNKAAGLAGSITSAYTCIEKQFYDKVVNGGQKARISLSEYTREGWTFHAKGLWLTTASESLPSATAIGSPNFGGRSVEKDLEAQIILLTDDLLLRSKMDQERKYLWGPSEKVDEEIFKRPDRKIPFHVWAFCKIGSGFM